VPDVEQEYPARSKVRCCHLEYRLQRFIARLVAHDVEKRDDCIEAAAKVGATDIADFAGEAAGRKARTSIGRRNHLRAALDAVDVESHRSEQTPVSAGSRAELENRPRGWNGGSDQSRDIFGFRRIILVATQQPSGR